MTPELENALVLCGFKWEFSPSTEVTKWHNPSWRLIMNHDGQKLRPTDRCITHIFLTRPDGSSYGDKNHQATPECVIAIYKQFLIWGDLMWRGQP